MKDVSIRKTQFWQTVKSIPLFLFTAAVCVGAYFGGNFKDESLRTTAFWWWFSAGILALLCRRYYKSATKAGVIAAVALSAAAGLFTHNYFVGVKLVEWAITAGVITGMSFLSFLPVLGFFEYRPIPKLLLLYPAFSFIALCFVMIASFTLSMLTYIILWIAAF